MVLCIHQEVLCYSDDIRERETLAQSLVTNSESYCNQVEIDFH